MREIFQHHLSKCFYKNPSSQELQEKCMILMADVQLFWKGGECLKVFTKCISLKYSPRKSKKAVSQGQKRIKNNLCEIPIWAKT